MVKISVVVPTRRLGGLDMTFTSLENQMFRDFELVLVDGWYRHRREDVEEYAEEFSFPVRHLYDGHGRMDGWYDTNRNVALPYVDGELLVFMDDYAEMLPYVLKQMWGLYEEAGAGLCGDRWICNPKRSGALKPSITRFEMWRLRQGEMDINKMSPPKDCLISTFKRNYHPGMFPVDNKYGGRFSGCRGEPLVAEVDGVEYHRAPSNGVYTMLFSVPREWILNLNGWSEEFEGYIYSDCEIGGRGMDVWGYTWCFCPTEDAPYVLEASHGEIILDRGIAPPGYDKHPKKDELMRRRRALNRVDYREEWRQRHK